MKRVIPLIFYTLLFIFFIFSLDEILYYSVKYLVRFEFIDYAWAIILITVSLKVCLALFSFKSDLSSKKSQLLNSEIAVLKKKQSEFLDNPQKYDEIQYQIEEIKKKYNIKTFSLNGCLNFILQLIAIISWYQVITRLTEAQNEKFLWIHLGDSDPLFIFPIVFFVIAVLSVHMNKVNKVHPVIYVIMLVISILISFVPGAIIIYILVNQIISLLKECILKLLAKKQIKQVDKNYLNTEQLRFLN